MLIETIVPTPLPSGTRTRGLTHLCLRRCPFPWPHMRTPPYLLAHPQGRGLTFKGWTGREWTLKLCFCQRLHEDAKSPLDLRGRSRWIAKFLREDCKLRLPLCRNLNGRRKGMGSVFLEHLFRRRSNFLPVQLAEHVDQQNVENVSGAASRVRPGACMEFLSDLFAQIEATDR